MSCTLMYQPYAMSYSSSSSCDRSSLERQKLFKFPHVPSPPDSSNSTTGGSPPSYSHGHTHTGHHPTNFSLPLVPPPAAATSSQSQGQASFNYHHHTHNFHLSPQPSPRSTSSSSRRSLTPAVAPSATITSPDLEEGTNSTRNSNDLDLPHTITSSSQSSTAASHHQSSHQQQQQQQQRAQYLSANCVVYENYDGDSAREVDDHFSRALNAAYSSGGGGGGSSSTVVEKSTGKNIVPMSTRNFPPSFWNSAYQPPPPPPAQPHPSRGLGGYSSADFYGSAAAMDYSGGIAGLHHHQSDPWHYPLTSHHHHPHHAHHHPSYSHHHHRAAADLAAAAAYTPMPSSSRFNPAQYSSFLFPSPAAASSARSFPGVKGVGDTGHWGAGGRYHPHETSWGDFHLADYTAAAAHYSNITASGNF